MNSKIFITLFVSAFVCGAPCGEAQTPSFPVCNSKHQRQELDGFCPRAEGKHLSRCCPDGVIGPPVKCYYYQDDTEAYFGVSTLRRCDLPAGGVVCCALKVRNCKKNPIVRDFHRRLLAREGQCCVESCPPTEYWMRDPADPAFRPDHKIGKLAERICDTSGVPENTCPVGLQMCDTIPETGNCPTPPPGVEVPGVTPPSTPTPPPPSPVPPGV
ncbi:MAG: hypothetical protein H6624_19770 [Bdellovibrionaceae bacterium]|nr:hypothetical protein [Bdellovibrionales bacterium]MCB9086589.1 hypothetical protein [Pseudobdellovibrionaceae bacterium]